MVSVVGSTRGCGRTNVAPVKGGAVTIEISVGGNDYVMVGMSLNDFGCPSNNLVGISVVERENEIIDIANREILINV